MTEIKELISTVVKSIVDDEKSVKITESETDEGFMYDIAVSKNDVGKLIGRGGRVASAIRTVVKACGLKHEVRVLLNVMNKPVDMV